MIASAEWLKLGGLHCIWYFVAKLNWRSFLLFCYSLVSETIPRHREYRSSPQSKKESLKKVYFLLFFKLKFVIKSWMLSDFQVIAVEIVNFLEWTGEVEATGTTEDQWA